MSDQALSIQQSAFSPQREVPIPQTPSRAERNCWLELECNNQERAEGERVRQFAPAETAHGEGLG